MRGPTETICAATLSVESLFVDTGEVRLFCTLVSPQDSSGECMLYFSPLFEERMWCQRMAFNFARQLAGRDRVSVLMPDYFGYGESDGASEDFSLGHTRRDVGHLLDFLRARGYTRFTLWGIRTGCAVALLAAPAHVPVVSRVFWAPVFNLRDYIHEGLRAGLSTQLLMFKRVLARRDAIIKDLVGEGHCIRDGYALNNIDGFRFGRAFYQETSDIARNSPLSQAEIPTLVVDVVRPGGEGDGAESSLESAGPEVGSHLERRQVHERSFWTIGRYYSSTAEHVYCTTTEWLRQLAGAGTTSAGIVSESPGSGG